MHTLITSTPSPASTPTPITYSERVVGGKQAEDDEGTQEDKVTAEQQQQQQQQQQEQQSEEREVTAFKYKPRGAILSKSFRVSDSSLSASRLASINRNVECDGGSNSASAAGAGHSTSYSKVAERESGYSSDHPRRSSLSEESSTYNSAEGSQTELSMPTGSPGGDGAKEQREGPVKTPAAAKSHPYSRRIDITPRASSPSILRARPRVLGYGKVDGDSRGAKPKSAALVRRSTMSSIPSGRRLLPATPVRRGKRPVLVHDKNPNSADEKSSVSEDNNMVDSFEAKLANSLEEAATKEDSPRDDFSEDSYKYHSGDGGGGGGGEGSLLHPSPAESTTSINSREEHNGSSSSSKKHTVQYKNKGEWTATNGPIFS